jgi:hypothetical protein
VLGHCSSQDLPQRLHESPCGFVVHGAAYGSAPNHFLLLELDLSASCTREAPGICHACVRHAAQLVLAIACTVLLDLVGEIGTLAAPCYICGELLG